MTTNNDLNQQRAVSSNTGTNVIKNSNQNQPNSPNPANRASGGSGATSPVNNVSNQNKDHKNQTATYDSQGNANNNQT